MHRVDAHRLAAVRARPGHSQATMVVPSRTGDPVRSPRPWTSLTADGPQTAV